MMNFTHLIRVGIFLIACFSVLPPECMTAITTISPGTCVYPGRKPCDAPRYCDQSVEYPDPDSCNSYFQCDNLEYLPRPCGSPNCFDSVNGGCIDCNLAVCQPNCSATAPTTAPPPGPCPVYTDWCKDINNATTYLFPDSYYCEIYYTCYNGNLDGANPKTCFTATACEVFNFEQQDCMEKDANTDCERQCPEVPTTAGTEATAITDASTATPTPPPVSGFSAGAIAGIVIVTVAVIAIPIIILLILLKPWRPSPKVEPSPEEVSDEPDEHSTPLDEGNPPPPDSQPDITGSQPDMTGSQPDMTGSQPDMTPVST